MIYARVLAHETRDCRVAKRGLGGSAPNCEYGGASSLPEARTIGGFTLLELLVVIAIIGVLVALLFARSPSCTRGSTTR